MATQAFSFFLDEHSKPFENIFDEWIDNEVYKYSIDEIMNRFNPEVINAKDRFHEIVTVPEPKKTPTDLGTVSNLLLLLIYFG